MLDEAPRYGVPLPVARTSSAFVGIWSGRGGWLMRVRRGIQVNAYVARWFNVLGTVFPRLQVEQEQRIFFDPYRRRQAIFSLSVGFFADLLRTGRYECSLTKASPP